MQRIACLWRCTGSLLGRAPTRFTCGATKSRHSRARITAEWTRARTAGGTAGGAPTLAQVGGEVICAAWADHHDIIGHFDAPPPVPPHFDWVASGTGFNRQDFESVWRDVAAFVAAAALH